MEVRAEHRDVKHVEIPHLDTIGRGIASLAHEAPERFQAVLKAGRQHYGQAAMAIGNAFSRRWLTRNGNPYLCEINELAVLADGPGLHLLNMSYEWSCTTSVAPLSKHHWVRSPPPAKGSVTLLPLTTCSYPSNSVALLVVKYCPCFCLWFCFTCLFT